MLRWAFQNAETDLNPPAAYCISATEDLHDEPRDPPRALLRHVSASEVPVRPFSECRMTGSARYSIVDAQSARPALFFAIGSVQWQDPSQAWVRVGFFQGGTWGRSWRCQVQSTSSGKWVIESCPVLSEW